MSGKHIPKNKNIIPALFGCIRLISQSHEAKMSEKQYMSTCSSVKLRPKGTVDTVTELDCGPASSELWQQGPREPIMRTGMSSQTSDPTAHDSQHPPLGPVSRTAALPPGGPSRSAGQAAHSIKGDAGGSGKRIRVKPDSRRESCSTGILGYSTGAEWWPKGTKLRPAGW